ncbi:hypothetical protein E2C01_018694 [Portunus trituberculatus]|uniref:Uncharacterized protein n=1 Tax=Portunus trituberculatus TaxID=210409 RepID=A0A5B7DX62_PORTR|nr:hypothetical protein [Portunus trituberculatus]
MHLCSQNNISISVLQTLLPRKDCLVMHKVKSYMEYQKIKQR